MVIRINTFKHLAYILNVKKELLEEVINNIDIYYRKKIEVKYDKTGNIKLDKNGNPRIRILYPSQGSLKSIQKRINKRILQKMQVPDYFFGAIKNRDNVANAHMHKGKKYKFLTDLKDFFPSITNRQVFQMFVENGFSHTVSRILTKLTTYKGQLPQGTPTSPMLANLVFIPTAEKLKEVAAQNQLTFTSFIDDLTFSAPCNFKELTPELIRIIREDGFKVSFDKTNYQTKPANITGVKVKNNSLHPTDEFEAKLKDKTVNAKTAKGRIEYKNKIERRNRKQKN